MNDFRKEGKPALFLELALPNEFGFSRRVNKYIISRFL